MLLVLPPLVVALTGRWGDTAVVAVLALAIVLTSPLYRDEIRARDYAVPLLLVIAGGVVAMAVAMARTGTAVALERFRLLVGVADAAEDAPDPEQLVDAVLDLVVPRMGDVGAVDAVLAGQQRRLGARVAAGIEPDVKRAIMRRRSCRLTRRAAANGRSRRARAAS